MKERPELFFLIAKKIYKTEKLYNNQLQEFQLFFNRIPKNRIEKIDGKKENIHVDYPTAKLRIKTEKTTIILNSSRWNGRHYFLKTRVSKLQLQTPGLPDFVSKLHWVTSTPTCLHIVYGCFHTPKAGVEQLKQRLSNSQRLTTHLLFDSFQDQLTNPDLKSEKLSAMRLDTSRQ